MRSLPNQQRGGLMLGFAGLIAFTAALCAAVLYSSAAAYRFSAIGIQKMQVRAAAEGAAVLLTNADTPTSGVLTVGECQVTITPAETSGTETIVGLRTAFIKNGSEQFGQNYRAYLRTDTTGTRILSLLEKVQ